MAKATTKKTSKETEDLGFAEEVVTTFDEKPMGQMTIVQFESFIKDYHDRKDEYETMKHELSVKKKEMDYMGEKLMSVLKEFNKTSYKSMYGTVIRSERWSWKTPKDDESRELFFNYLKEKGIYDTMISVNSQTLNSFAKKELEAAKEEGNIDFEIPGLQEPSVTETISLRR